MDDTKVSEEYKKAYNQADMICRYMPHLLKSIKQMPKDEPKEFTKGFQDRIKQYEKEQEAIKSFSYDDIKKKYGKNAPNKDKSRDIDKD